MDSKKSGMMHLLRRKVMPRLRRDKTSLSKALHLGHNLDHRMSSSVPDMRDMRQDYSRVPSDTQLQWYDTPSHSSPSSPLVKPARGGGSGLKVGGEGEKSKCRQSALADCTDWASSQESFNSVCGEETSSPETNHRDTSGMEPEELALPEMMTVYSPDSPSMDSSQVRTLTSQV